MRISRASRPSENADGKWHADQETVWDMKANTFRTLGWTSADAAGLSLLVGLVRPDEGLPTSQGGQGVINHAIRFTPTCYGVQFHPEIDAEVMRGYVETRREILVSEGFDVDAMLAAIDDGDPGRRTLQNFVTRFL